jgi:hypothetical protein
MNTPNPTLMQHYGTEDVFLAKTADALPLLARLGMGILNFELASSSKKKDEEQKFEDALRYEAVREHEAAKMQQANEGLRHTHAPMLLQAGSDVPVGWDEGMVRLASVAALAGADMAKEAGIGDFVTAAKTMGAKALPALKGFGQKALGTLKSVGAATAPAAGAAPAAGDLITRGKKLLGGGLGLKTNLLLAGGTLGAGVLASKGISAGTRAMSREAPGPAVYGAPARGGIGYQIPYGVNQYGQPQVGTPLG